MKKLFLFLILSVSMLSYGQVTSFMINNYSSYYLKGRFGAMGSNGNCHPTVSPNTDGDYVVPPLTTGIEYRHFRSSNSSSLPITEWYVRMSPANPIQPRQYDHPTFFSTSVVTLNTDWAFFWFQTYDGGGTNYEDFTMGNPVYDICGNGSNYTYQSGTSGLAEAEWFTIGPYTYVQIFDL